MMTPEATNTLATPEVLRGAVSDWIRGGLTKKGWRQPELAKRSGVSRQQISNLINSKSEARRATLEKLARALDEPLPPPHGEPLDVDLLDDPSADDQDADLPGEVAQAMQCIWQYLRRSTLPEPDRHYVSWVLTRMLEEHGAPADEVQRIRDAFQRKGVNLEQNEAPEAK